MAIVGTSSCVNAEFKVEGNKVYVYSLKVQPTLMFEIKEMQETNEYHQTYFDKCKKGETLEFHIIIRVIETTKSCAIKVEHVLNNLELEEKIL